MKIQNEKIIVPGVELRFGMTFQDVENLLNSKISSKREPDKTGVGHIIVDVAEFYKILGPCSLLFRNNQLYKISFCPNISLYKNLNNALSNEQKMIRIISENIRQLRCSDGIMQVDINSRRALFETSHMQIEAICSADKTNYSVVFYEKGGIDDKSIIQFYERYTQSLKQQLIEMQAKLNSSMRNQKTTVSVSNSAERKSSVDSKTKKHVDIRELISENKDKTVLVCYGGGMTYNSPYYKGLMIQGGKAKVVEGKADGSQNRCVLYGACELSKYVNAGSKVILITPVSLGFKSNGKNKDLCDSFAKELSSRKCTFEEVVAKSVKQQINSLINTLNNTADSSELPSNKPQQLKHELNVEYNESVLIEKSKNRLELENAFDNHAPKRMEASVAAKWGPFIKSVIEKAGSIENINTLQWDELTAEFMTDIRNVEMFNYSVVSDEELFYAILLSGLRLIPRRYCVFKYPDKKEHEFASIDEMIELCPELKNLNIIKTLDGLDWYLGMRRKESATEIVDSQKE